MPNRMSGLTPVVIVATTALSLGALPALDRPGTRSELDNPTDTRRAPEPPRYLGK